MNLIDVRDVLPVLVRVSFVFTGGCVSFRCFVACVGCISSCSVYAGFILSTETFTAFPFIRSLYVLSALFNTSYGPSYGGCSAPAGRRVSRRLSV